MNEYSHIGKRLTRTEESPALGTVDIMVEVVNFRPCLESWQYDPPYMDDDTLLPDRDEVKRPANYCGKDQTLCTLTCHNPGEGWRRRKHVSLVRSIRPGRLGSENPTWRTSCMVREQTGIYIRPDKEQNRLDPYSSDHTMMWELAGPDPITVDDQLDRLLENGHRPFDPDIQTQL